MAITGSQGARVGNYILMRQLGVGGMAEVWLARDQSNAQLRAMKYLNAQFAGIPEVEARFQAEGENQLVHPNIVRIYEVGQVDGSSFMVMDFIEGRDLEKIMDSRRGPLKIPEAVDIGIQILAGLGYAHASGIVHRDIKPSNVLVDDEGHAYLMDFGIAKAMRSARSMTQVNARLGTPDYMSPEQIRSSRDVDARSDIYSFGCLLYELLTGWPPFDSNTGYESVHDIQTAHVTVAPTPPAQRRNGLPPELDAVVMHCLQKAKEERPQTCEEIIVVLDAFRASAAQAQQRATTPVTFQPGTFQTNPAQPAITNPGAGAGVPTGGHHTGSQAGAKTGPPPPPPAFSTVPRPVSTTAPKASTGPAPFQTHVEQPAQGYATAPALRETEKFAPQGPFHNAAPAAQPGTTEKPTYGHQMRTPTITDTPAITGASTAAPAAQAAGYANAKPQTARQEPARQEPARSNRMLLTVAGVVLLLAAAGGGAWAFLHKSEPETAQTPKPDPNVKPTDPVVTPQPTPDPKKKPVDVTPPPNGHTSVKPSTPGKPPAPGGGSSGDVTPIRPVTKLASGTITWTGTNANPGPQIVDIYIPTQRATVGAVSLQSAPVEALPIAVTVASGNAKVMNQPAEGRSYSTFRIGVLGTGQQTVVLRWTQLPSNNPQ